MAENIAMEGKQLYENDEITGDDLEKILVAISNLFEYLNQKYGDDELLEKEVRKMTRTLYDPIVEEKGKIEGKLEAAKAALQEGASVEFVAKITKLNIEVIKKIKNDIEQN